MPSILWAPHTPIVASEDEPECPAGGRHVYVFLPAGVESGLYTSEWLCDGCGHRAPDPELPRPAVLSCYYDPEEEPF